MNTAIATSLASETVVADVLLVRMLLPKAQPKEVRMNVGKLLASELSEAEFDEIRDQLVSAGFLKKTNGKKPRFELTDAGRERAFRFVGTESFPPKTTWSLVVSKYLFPKSAGLSTDAAIRLNSADKLAAFILKRKYEVAGSTVNQVIQAIVCKELGFPDQTTLNGVMCTILNRMVGSERLTKDDLIQQLPLFATGLANRNADGFRTWLVRDWLTHATSDVLAGETRLAEPTDLSDFAATVRTLASNSPPEDRFHDNKVFISSLWCASQREPSFPRLSLPEFKELLIRANSCDLLHLSRADLVQAMDQQLVADSETMYLNATFHFVLLEGGVQ